MDDIRRFGQPVQFFVPFASAELSQKVKIVPYLSIDEIVLLKKFFGLTKNLKKIFAKSKIRNYFNKLHNFDEISSKIDAKISQDNQIKDNASEQLSKIRKQKREINYRIKQILSDMIINRSNIFTSSNIVERNGHYVLPVKTNFRKDIKGIIHSYSNTRETIFIEPEEITDYSAQLAELGNREMQEIEAILQDLTNFICTRLPEIESDIESVIRLDLLFAKVDFADELNATKPISGKYLKIINGYHPILKRFEDNVVPLNLRLNSNKKILLISGPNAGGKTIVLKTVGILALMAKFGLFIPADEESSIPFFDEVYADIGDEQSIESHLSTFAAHVKQIKDALAANPNSLVLLDELMSQTSVEEGSALAAAIMEEFAERKSLVLATTHNENLKIFVSKRDDMINAGMEFTDHPTYRLIMGIPQASNALKLASQLGLKTTIVESAYSYLDKEKMSLNELFEDLSKELKSVQEEKEKLSGLVKDYETKLNDFNTKKKKEMDELKAKYKREIIQAKRTIENLIKDLKKVGPTPQLVHDTRQYLNEKIQVEKDRKPYYPEVGEIIRIIDLKKMGQVISEHQGKYKVSLDNMYFWVDPRDIESVNKE